IGQNNLDLYGFHHVLRWMGGSPALAPHPPENSARPELTGRLSLGFAKPMRGQWPPAAAAEAAGSGFALREPLGADGAVCRAASTARAAKGWAGDKRLRRSRTLQRARPYCCRLLSINMCEFRSRV